MANTNYGDESMNSKHDGLDDELDAALLKYAEAEPRVGLEQRVLANLRAQPRASASAWWRWPAVVAAAAVILVGVISLVFRSPHRLSVAVVHAPGKIAPQVIPGAIADIAKPVPVSKHTARATPVKASVPHLDQFPSPQPLSEQEQMLASYVAKYPEHAALIAQARSEELQRDLAEESAVKNSDR
jgi:hypothetical protein